MKYAVPAGIALGWCAWPALTPTFKQQTFGFDSSAPAAATAPKESNGTYVFEKQEIGERPVLIN